jgi:hypothetical protein
MNNLLMSLCNITASDFVSTCMKEEATVNLGHGGNVYITLQYLLNTILDFTVLIFLFSCVSKLYDRMLFKHTLLMFPYMLPFIAVTISYVLPLGEFVLAILLYLNLVMAKYIAVLILTLFSVLAFLVRHRNILCSCFGNFGGQTLSSYTVIRNGVLILLVLSTLFLDDRVSDVTCLASVALMPVLYLIGRVVVGNQSLIRALTERGIL